MRLLYNYMLMFLALVTSIYLGLRIAQPELAGHWHVSQSMGTHGNGMDGIYHFNINHAGEIRVHESIEGQFLLPGYVEKLARRIHFGGECWYVGANYRISGDRMDITGGGDHGPAWRAVAHRAHPGDCDLSRDLFLHLPVEVRLPENKSYSLVPVSDLDNFFSLYLGEDKGTGEVKLLAHGYLPIEGEEELNREIDREGIGINLWAGQLKGSSSFRVPKLTPRRC